MDNVRLVVSTDPWGLTLKVLVGAACYLASGALVLWASGRRGATADLWTLVAWPAAAPLLLVLGAARSLIVMVPRTTPPCRRKLTRIR